MTQNMDMPDPGSAELRDYIVIFADPHAPVESAFSAIDDEHAISLARKQLRSIYHHLENENVIEKLMSI